MSCKLDTIDTLDTDDTSPFFLLLRQTAHRRPIGDDDTGAGEDQASDVRFDHSIGVRREQRQPADFGDGDLLGLVVSIEAFLSVLHFHIGGVDQFVELGIRVVAVVIADIGA